MLNLPFRKKKEDALPDKDELKEKKPRKPRKKVEPPKPWGRIERIIVFIFLISAPLLSILFFIHSKKNKNLSQTPNSNTKIFDNVLPSPPKDTQGLKNDLVKETQNLQGTYGIWIQALDGSYSVGVNENTQFDGASLFKLPLMLAYYKKIDDGSISPDATYTLKYSDAAAGAGVLADLDPGTVITYHDIVEAMGKNSDNTAFQIMEGVLGSNAETNIINDLGMANTDFDQSLTTPSDIGLLFYKLENNNLISSKSKDEFLSFLTKTDFESLIPAGVDNNIKVSHKYGADSGELNDAGIVFTQKPYVLIILSKDINLDEANLEIPKISQIVYNYLK